MNNTNSSNKNTFPVERILKKRIKNGRQEYFLKWKGYDKYFLAFF